ncbi:MAG TPA: ABC transporter substrate-binding protein [Minicystis sp.]|nr:ABC transporter substrate-binding protein [Minicystis sp.]
MTRRLQNLFTVILTALAIVLGAGVAWAGPATSAVQKTQGDLFAALKAGDDKKVESLFNQFIDYNKFAQDSLGSEWGNRSASEKAEFTDLLKRLVGQAYKCNLKKIMDFSISYTSEESKDGATLVKSTATKSGQSPVEINFKVANEGGTWRLQDIETEDVSLVDNNRSRFVQIIKKDGFPALLQKMKDKLAKPACES